MNNEEQLKSIQEKQDNYKRQLHERMVDDTLRAAAESANAYHHTQLKPMIRAEVRTNEAGKEYVVALHDDGSTTSISGAVQKIKEDPANHFLFRDGVKPAPATPQPKPVDYSTMSNEEYRQRRAKGDLPGLFTRTPPNRR